MMIPTFVWFFGYTIHSCVNENEMKWTSTTTEKKLHNNKAAYVYLSGNYFLVVFQNMKQKTETKASKKTIKK